ncbi:hypothetical protein TNCT_711621 [Trichonephila clavata]|uniref:Secreted protein n=1 Tax=Trichonephila clavata TaxID=2740835 RepID=A0A8X6KM52_TRICU|nr:hypothetical protein TNCT_711621 [Trichonephila clavata]
MPRNFVSPLLTVVCIVLVSRGTEDRCPSYDLLQRTPKRAVSIGRVTAATTRAGFYHLGFSFRGWVDHLGGSGPERVTLRTVWASRIMHLW